MARVYRPVNGWKEKIFASQALMDTNEPHSGEAEIPNTNIQAPEKYQGPSSKKGRRFLLGFWSLDLLWCLEIGIWSFHHTHPSLVNLFFKCTAAP
jgi:hypothetical protein